MIPQKEGGIRWPRPRAIAALRHPSRFLAATVAPPTCRTSFESCCEVEIDGPSIFAELALYEPVWRPVHSQLG